MAIWQYQIFIVPEEEVNFYFEKDTNITYDALNEIEWWKHHRLSIDEINFFKKILPMKKSWTTNIMLFGDESSNCVEVLMEKDRVVEISVRIDLRYNYKQVVQGICEFAQNHNCMVLNNDLKIFSPSIQLIEQDIISFPNYKLFVNKLRW